MSKQLKDFKIRWIKADSDSEDGTVRALISGHPDIILDDPDFEELIKRWNLHDEMLVALRELISDNHREDISDNSYNLAIAAINKAEGTYE